MAIWQSRSRCGLTPGRRGPTRQTLREVVVEKPRGRRSTLVAPPDLRGGCWLWLGRGQDPLIATHPLCWLWFSLRPARTDSHSHEAHDSLEWWLLNPSVHSKAPSLTFFDPSLVPLRCRWARRSFSPDRTCAWLCMRFNARLWGSRPRPPGRSRRTTHTHPRITASCGPRAGGVQASVNRGQCA